MNNRKAKALRAQARMLTTVTGAQLVESKQQTKQHRRIDGVIVFYDTRTLAHAPGTYRRIYQDLKRAAP